MDSPEPESPAADDRPEPTTSERLEQGFANRIEAFADAARRVRGCSDAEAIHDLRVATRRLVAALRVWRSLIPSDARRGAIRRLRRMRRRIGRARELEVHAELLEARLPRRGAAGRPALAAVLLRLRGRLARRRRAAAQRVSPRRVKRVLRDLEEAAGGLRGRLLHDPAAIQEGLAEGAGLAAAARASVSEAAAAPEDVRLHEARIAVKKWRYALECLEEAAPGAAAGDVTGLRRMQRALGDVHDLALLRDLMGKLALEAGEQAAERLQAMLERLEAERHRAVRRFQRRAVELVGEAADNEAGSDAGGPAPGAPHDAGEPESVERHAKPPEPSPAAPSPALEARDVRWKRMASWLEGTREPGE